MELNPGIELTRTEANQLSQILGNVVLNGSWSAAGAPESPTEFQKEAANAAVDRLLQPSGSGMVPFDLEPENLDGVVGALEIALDNPRRAMFALITDLDLDAPTQYAERGNALRSLATAADFVKLVRDRKA